jgi:hypothetical protein
MNNIATQQQQDPVKTAFQLINCLLICFFFTVLVLTILPQLGIIQTRPQPISSALPVKQMFLILAIVLAVSGFVARRIFFKMIIVGEDKEKTSPIRSFHIAHVVSFVLFEAIGILGIINYMISGDANASLLFGLLAMGCMLLEKMIATSP